MLSPTTLMILYCYGIPMLLCNMRTIWVMWRRRRKFNSSYYKIFLISGCNDILLYVLNNYTIRLPSFPFLYQNHYSGFDEYSYGQGFFYFALLYTSYFTNAGCFLLSLNRLTAMWKFSSYEQLWSRHFKWAVLFAFGSTAALTIPAIGVPVRYGAVESESGEQVGIYSPEASPRIALNRSIGTWSVVVFTAAGLILDLSTLALWYRRSRLIPQRHRDYQGRLVFLTVAIYSIHLSSCIFNAVEVLKLLPIDFFLSYAIVSDVVALVPTFAILIASPPIRREVFGIGIVNGISRMLGMFSGSSVAPEKTIESSFAVSSTIRPDKF